MHRHLVSPVGKVAICCGGGSGSIPGRTKTQGLKIIEEKRREGAAFALTSANAWLNLGIFSDKDVKPKAQSLDLSVEGLKRTHTLLVKSSLRVVIPVWWSVSSTEGTSYRHNM